MHLLQALYLALLQVFDTSDLPGGVVNIITGDRDHLSKYLTEHQDVQAMWYFGSAAGSQYVEHASADNVKRTWVNYGQTRDWLNPEQGQGEEFLYHATQSKNIWIPMGDIYANQETSTVTHLFQLKLGGPAQPRIYFNSNKGISIATHLFIHLNQGTSIATHLFKLKLGDQHSHAFTSTQTRGPAQQRIYFNSNQVTSIAMHLFQLKRGNQHSHAFI